MMVDTARCFFCGIEWDEIGPETSLAHWIRRNMMICDVCTAYLEWRRSPEGRKAVVRKEAV